MTLRVFVDAEGSTVYLTGESAAPLTVRASYETWRTQDYTGNAGDSPLGGSGLPNLYESADVIDNSQPGRISFYHRNAWSCVAQTAAVQFMTPYLADIPDPLANLTFGGQMSLTGAAIDGNAALLTPSPVTSFELKIATHSAQTPTAAAWLADAAAVHDAAPAAATAMQRTAQWWHDYWNRSWLFVSGDGPPVPAAMGKNNHPLRLGATSAGANPFTGSMARASFYQRVLTPAEIAALAAGAPDSAVAVTAGLAGTWLLGNTAGGVCPGGQGIPRDLTVSGAITVTTTDGAACARFDGGYFSAADDPAFEPAAGATMEAWIRLDAGEANDARLFDKVTPNQQDGYLFDLYPGRALRLYNGFDGLSTAVQHPPDRCLAPCPHHL